MPYQHYLFDLDGTLTDPGLGIKNSIRYALKKFELPALTEGELDAFVGPPLMESFEKYCGADREKAMEMVNAGASLDEIVATMNEKMDTIRSFLVPADFDYLRRGGRLSPWFPMWARLPASPQS